MTLRVALVLGLVLVPSGLSAAPEPPGPKVPAQPAKERVDAARKAFEGYWRMLRHGTGGTRGDPETIYVWSRRWMEAQQALSNDKAATRAAVHAHLDRMKELEKVFASLARAQQGTQADADAGRYYRAEAEVWLSQVKGK